MSVEKLFSFPDAQEKNSEVMANKKEKMQKDEEINMRYNLMKKIYLSDLKNWPIFNLLKPDFLLQIYMVMVYDELNTKAVIVTKDKNVYSFSYKHIQLNTDGTSTFYPEKLEELCGKNIKTFAHSSSVVLALTEEGEVYSWQYEKHKFDDEFHLFVPTRVAGLSEKRIVDIACGSCHSLALTSDGKVYFWGHNEYEQVGNESTATFDSSLPKQIKHVLENKNVVQIACGHMFNMVLTDEGKLYGWGYNESGQISIDTTTTLATSRRIKLGSRSVSNPAMTGDSLTASSNIQSHKHCVHPYEITTISEKIVKVACGSGHTLALTDKGKVYAWGMNNRSQVGINSQQKICGPIMVNVPLMVVEIAAYDYTSVAIDNNGTVFVWGNCFEQNIITPISTELWKIHDAFAYSNLVMHKPLTVSVDDYECINEVLNSKEILESLKASFDRGSTCDFIVKVEGQPIYVHKAILKIRSQYFKNKFQHDWIENNQSTLDPSMIYTVSDQYSYIVYKAFLKYLYTGTVDVPSENTLELMNLADKYHETSLKRDCGQKLKQAISESNVVFFYKEAIKYNAKELEEFCFQFALRHMKAVVLSEDYIKLDMNTKDNFIRRAADENVFRT